MSARAASITRIRQTRSQTVRPEIGGLLTQREVADFLHVDRSTLWYWRKKGQGPRRIRLGERVVRYRWADVKSWLASSQEGQ